MPTKDAPYALKTLSISIKFKSNTGGSESLSGGKTPETVTAALVNAAGELVRLAYMSGNAEPVMAEINKAAQAVGPLVASYRRTLDSASTDTESTKPNIAALFDAFTDHRMAIQRAMGQHNFTQAVQDGANAALHAKLTEFGIADHFDWAED